MMLCSRENTEEEWKKQNYQLEGNLGSDLWLQNIKGKLVVLYLDSSEIIQM